MAFPESFLSVSGQTINVAHINYLVERKPYCVVVHLQRGSLALEEKEAAHDFVEFLAILRDPNVEGVFVRFGVYLVNVRQLIRFKESAQGVRVAFPGESFMITEEDLYPDDEDRLIDQFPSWRRVFYGERE